MAVSVFDLFSIGIGPSSSHTVGPMRAARRFLLNAKTKKVLSEAHSLKVELYGSLALTGKGHATDIAILLGLEGETPEHIDPSKIEQKIKHIRKEKTLHLMGEKKIPFDEHTDLIFHYDKTLPFHPNGMRFTFYGKDGLNIFEHVLYSIGGGFVVEHGESNKEKVGDKVPFPFVKAAPLLEIGKKHRMTIAQIMLENEKTWRTEEEIRKGILNIAATMKECVKQGCKNEGRLPGGLNVKRRAPGLLKHLNDRKNKGVSDPAEVMDWVSLWALAVNEENAAGGRVVTAPTNGAAGVIPSVLHYYLNFTSNPTEQGVIEYFLTAAAMGILYKHGASISAAEMGCMGEVGVACSMAAAGLTAALGGTNAQIENAAEIGMEHNLGLTCDPVKGLVQIPCIERNTMGALKAINASRLALQGDGSHRVLLDEVIETMRQTGIDMSTHYKETSLGGLAVNVAEC